MSRQLALRHHDLFSGTSPVSLPGTRHGWLDRPGLVLLVGAIATAILGALEIANVGGDSSPLKGVHVVVSSAACTIALAMMVRRPDTVLFYRPLALAAALAGTGMVILNVAAPAVGMPPAVLAANLLFISGAILSCSIIVPSLYRRLDRQALVMAGLDGGIMAFAGTSVLLTLWRVGQVDTGIAQVMVPVMAAGLFASAGVAAIVALALRSAPRLGGVWCGIVGVALVGLAWIVWVDTVLRGQYRDSTTSLLFSFGIIVVGYAWVTWTDDVGGGRTYERIAHSLVDWLPIGAILLCVGVAAVPHARVQGVDLAPLGTAAVVFLSISRQRLLIVRERWASRLLAGEVQERAQTMLSLARLERATTLEQTATSICAEALRLDGIDAARVYAFGPNGGAVPLAVAGDGQRDDVVGEELDPGRSFHMRTCASAGAWIDSDPAARTAGGGLLGEAFAPMHWEDRIVGVVSMGTSSQEDAQRLAGRLPTMTEFGVVSAALLGPMLAEHWHLADVRLQLEAIIADHAFTPVFQAVVELESREIIGFEALTRFADGTRPDQRFIEAHNAGMSVRLEKACIGDQLEAAAWLPPGTWVSLNVSPSLASAIVPLVSALERADRDVVLEITEHVEIGDYRQLVDALDLVRGKARLAVDDAGAGYAGLRHILELCPQFVKLDLSLVRNVDADPARQAMVAGMAHFARNAGCELIAEGIETHEELNELIRLGVHLGQGYLFGMPGPIPTD